MNARGFVKIRRGLEDHLPYMSDRSTKLYLLLHLRARWKGPERGTVTASYDELAKSLNWSTRTVDRAMAQLQPRYVQIVQRGNDRLPTIIRIARYDKSAGDKFVASGVASGVASASEKPNKTLAIRSPKKVVEGCRSKAKAAAAALDPTPNSEPENSVWSFLEILPCGPIPFRTLLETGWASRNGGPYSILIGDALDAWKATEGQNPKGCAPLFQALSRLRERERKIPNPSARDSAGIHVFTPEEIPA